MKSKTVAALLAFFLGGVGAHKFYLGKNGQGILYLIFVWTWIPAILGLIEGISYIVNSQEEFDAKYNNCKKVYTDYSGSNISPNKMLQSSSNESDFQSATAKMAEFNKNRSTSISKGVKSGNQ